MNYERLKPKVAELLAADPLLSDQQIAEALCAPTQAVAYSRFVTFRTLLSELDTVLAMSVIGKVKTAAAADPGGVLAAVLPSLQDTADGCGIDMANANARAFVDGLVADGTLLAEEGQAVKGLAERNVSWAESVGITRLRAGHVREARAS